jgi:hypothetical protein
MPRASESQKAERLNRARDLLLRVTLIPWFVWTESLWEGSWPELNYVGLTPGDMQLRVYAEFRVASVLLISITAACCLFRSLPPRWSLRGSPLRQRIWPCFVFGLAPVVVWFLQSAQPYRVPSAVDAPRALVRVLHVEKQGLQFRESGITAFRDRRFFRWADSRRLFQYRFDSLEAWGVLESAAFERVNSNLNSEDLRKHRTPPAKRLLSWNAEGWYVVLEDERVLAFH